MEFIYKKPLSVNRSETSFLSFHEFSFSVGASNLVVVFQLRMVMD